MPHTPHQIIYQGPEGWRVVADEDGVHIRTTKGDALEQADATQLIHLFNAAVAQWQSGQAPIPRPPTRDEIRKMSWERREQSARDRAVRAVRAEFQEDTPF